MFLYKLVYLGQLIQRIVFLCVFIMVFYLQQIWLHQNITRKLAFAYMKQIYFTVFPSKLLSTKRVFQFPLQFHGKVSKRFTV
jgi:hypothetical protein